MASAAATLRLLVLQEIRRRPLTADEAAEKLKRNILSIRPRLSELVNSGRIEKSDERRRNASGKSAIVWRATAKGMDHEQDAAV